MIHKYILNNLVFVWSCIRKHIQKFVSPVPGRSRKCLFLICGDDQQI